MCQLIEENRKPENEGKSITVQFQLTLESTESSEKTQLTALPQQTTVKNCEFIP